MITADLTGKTALITGGASGIGLAAVELSTECGATVAIGDVNADRINEQVARLTVMGRKVIVVPADLRDADAVQAMVDKAASHSVTLEIIPPSDFEKQTEQLWSDIMSVNLMSVFRAAKAAAPYPKDAQGAIVSTSSMSGFRSVGSSSPYCVA